MPPARLTINGVRYRRLGRLGNLRSGDDCCFPSAAAGLTAGSRPRRGRPLGGNRHFYGRRPLVRVGACGRWNWPTAPCSTRYFASLAHPLSDYTFSQLYTWRNSLSILWKQIDGHLCVFANGAGDLTLLMPPIGDTGADRALAACLRADGRVQRRPRRPAPHPRRVRQRRVARPLRPRRGCDVEPMGFDYVYDVGKMIDLAGGDLASKRQAKNRFMPQLRAPRRALLRGRTPATRAAGCSTQWKTHQDDPRRDRQRAPAQAKRLKEVDRRRTCASESPAEIWGSKGMVVYVEGRRTGWDSSAASRSASRSGRDQSSITIEKTDLTSRASPSSSSASSAARSGPTGRWSTSATTGAWRRSPGRR